jgi:hypothetical protein
MFLVSGALLVTRRATITITPFDIWEQGPLAWATLDTTNFPTLDVYIAIDYHCYHQSLPTGD